ncbi:mobilization protein [Gluconacetobacter entanii]|uniref:Mobilization protein n=1 Tax=Gluconacetobacter entanii TaxID=108528 RepID=A0A318PUD7_9PROT|nr:mobilization protein [Gluconacetobacter entanii]PYD60713.1 mobilization protein [Gluconacetobacter entanii]
MSDTVQHKKSAKILAAEERLEQAKRALRDAKQAESRQQKKIADRQKIILGATLLNLAERDERFSLVIDELLNHLTREQDVRAFRDHGFVTPRPVNDHNSTTAEGLHTGT